MDPTSSIPTLPGVQGLIVSIFTTLITIAASGYFVIKKFQNDFKSSTAQSDKKAESEAEKAEKRVMDAMQTELGIVRGSLEDVRKENAEIKRENSRLNQVMSTIYSALRARGVHITIDGGIVHINDGMGRSTSMPIQDDGQ